MTDMQNKINYIVEIEGYYEIGDFKISKLCYQTFPCKHVVINKKYNTKRILSAPDIHVLLEDNPCFLFRRYFLCFLVSPKKICPKDILENM